MAALVTLGVTGGVGSGKSTVMAWLSDRHVPVLDADAVVHRLLAGHPDVVQDVVATFGSRIELPGGGVDRTELAAIVFQDEAALTDLEAIVHPFVMAHVADWVAERGGPVAAVEAVKLVESGMHERLDALWLIACDLAERRKRLADRGWSPAEAEARIAASPSMGRALAVADAVIDNSGTPTATESQLEMAWRRLAAGDAAGDGP